MRMLALVSDAFGGYGGIAKFNREFAAAASRSGIGSLTFLPRRAPAPQEPRPARVFQLPPPNGKLAFALRAAEQGLRSGYDSILCGHINLLPVANLAGRLSRRPGRRPRLCLVLHGVDAWTQVPAPGLRSLDLVVSVSQVTLERFLGWSGFPAERTAILPNTVDTARFTPGPRLSALAARHGIAGGPTILSLARMEPADRDKGFAELLAALPRLVERHPRLRYVAAGDGGDRPHLERMVRQAGLADHVVFTGFVPEDEKPDLYRLADAFVLCGRQEGFGIVLLEAMASGVPVVASKLDGSREAVLGGTLGGLADPNDPAELATAILDALDRPGGQVPAGLVEHFGHDAFAERTSRILARLARSDPR